MNSPNDNNNDEEKALPRPPPPLPNEISFARTTHHSTTFNDDDNTVPSELSTLIAPSTLTPNYNYQLHGGSPIATSGKLSGHTSSSSFKSQKAFQLAALLAMLSIGTLFGADVVYMMITSPDDNDDNNNRDTNNNRSRPNNSSVNPSSAVSMDAWRISGGEPDSTSIVDDELIERGEQKQTKAQAKAAKLAKKRAKATKKKKHKKIDKGDDDDYNDTGEDTEFLSQDGELDDDDTEEDSEDEEDDEEDATITRTTKQSFVGPMIFPNNYNGDGSDDDFGELISNNGDSSDEIVVSIPEAKERCPYVIQTFQVQNSDITNMDFLTEKYNAQSTSPNVFYRATALIFWQDFGTGYWGRDENKSINFGDLVLLNDARYEDGTPLSPKSTWTWITGDQHLSNFGAWRNRGGEVVFSVNDFDEAAIYDFHMDVLRAAVSICDHGFTNGLSEDDIREALEAYTYTYVKTAIDYVGSDKELLYELTPKTSTGVLRDFLVNVENNKSRLKQVHKFTEVGEDGTRKFIRDENTNLVDVSPEIEEKIRAQITPFGYGATLMQMGWKVPGWDDDFFTVLDVARRVGSGVGSYGVDRFYVLLKGEDMLIEEDQDVLSSSVILDIKYEPMSAVSRILNALHPETKAWYDDMFFNEADRAAEAQLRLTSYTDPFVGWLIIDGDSYIVRQRSPYKHSFDDDLDTLTNHRAFAEFAEQIGIATATAHVRGTVTKSPGQFKHVIKLLLAGDHNRRRWSELVAGIALSYRNQVLLDYGCFKEYVKENFPSRL